MTEAFQAGLISGTGIEGKGIALRLAAHGVTVGLGSRSPERALETARELNGIVGREVIVGMDNLELIQKVEILFLSVPFVHAENVLESYSGLFREGQILVDVTVPVVFDKGPRMLDLEASSGAELLQQRLPSFIPVVALFKTLPAHLLGDLELALNCDEFICSDSGEAKQRVLEVVGRIAGLRWLDAGPLRYSRCLEGMTMLAIGLNRRFKSKTARYQVVGIG